jgi:hypothetical protein
MRKLMNLFVLSCRKVTELIEKETVVKLSFKEKVQLNVHKSMCDACSLYEKQSKKIDKILFDQFHKTDPETIEIHKNEGLKERIKNNF